MDAAYAVLSGDFPIAVSEVFTAATGTQNRNPKMNHYSCNSSSLMPTVTERSGDNRTPAQSLRGMTKMT